MPSIPFVRKRPAGPNPWIIFGSTEAAYARWVSHVCAMACCRSLILASRGEAPTLWELTKRGIELGVYRETSGGISGAFHDPLAELLREFGIGAERFGHIAEPELRRLAGRYPIMLSVDLAKVCSTDAGSHLVLIACRTAAAYQVLDNACILNISGIAWLEHKELCRISNGKGLIIKRMPHSR